MTTYTPTNPLPRWLTPPPGPTPWLPRCHPLLRGGLIASACYGITFVRHLAPTTTRRSRR